MSSDKVALNLNGKIEPERVLVFTATYNERDGIREFCEQVLACPLNADLLIVDDNSPDGTGQLLDELSAAEPRLKIVHRPRKLGLGSAHKLAFVYALLRSYGVLVTMDADFSHAPESIPQLVGELENADFVIGSRYVRGGYCEYKGFRKFMSVLANFLARSLLNIPLHEFTTSFRAFRLARLRDIDFRAIRSQGYSFFLESLWVVHRAGFRCRETPIRFAERKHGKSKISRNEIIWGVVKLLELFWRRLFIRAKPSPSGPHPVGNCHFCGSDLLVEKYPPSGRISPEPSHFRCSSAQKAPRPQVVECLVCALIASGEKPDTEALSELYGQVVDEDYLLYLNARQKTFVHTFNFIAPFLGAPGRLLEVGAYCGLFLEEARRRGWAVEGIEPADWAREQTRARFGFDLHPGTLQEAAGNLNGGYDVIAMWDVLEHLDDPLDALRTIRELLRDDGWLCLSTLDTGHWLPRLMGASWPWYMHMHLYYFSDCVLREMLHGAGYDVVQVRPQRYYVSAEYLFRKISYMLPRPLGWFSRVLKPLAHQRLLVPYQLGDIKLYVCRKRPGQRQP